MKLDDYDLKILDEVEEIIGSNLEIKKYPEKNEGYIEHDSLICGIEELIGTIKSLKEQYEDLERDLEDNYKPITKEEMYLG